MYLSLKYDFRIITLQNNSKANLKMLNSVSEMLIICKSILDEEYYNDVIKFTLKQGRKTSIDTQ